MTAREWRIEPVVGRTGRRAFSGTARQVYAHDPNWIPPLPGEETQTFDPVKNPALEGVRTMRWVLRRDGHLAGRVAAFAPVRRPGVGYFGWFECDDSPDAAVALLRTAESWLAGQGCHQCHGPIDVVPRDRIGLLVEGFDRPPVMFTPYNPPYYARLLEAAGYRADVHLRAYGWTSDYSDRRAVERLAGRLEGRSTAVRIRRVDPRRLAEETRIVARLVNTTLADAWHFEPISDREAAQLASLLRPIIAPELAFIAEDGAGPCGVALGVPDANWWWRHAGGKLLPLGWARLLATRRRIPQARVMALGVLPAHRGTGLALRLIAELMRGGPTIGMHYVELSQVFEANPVMDSVLRGMGFPVVRRYAVFSRSLGRGELV